ncbi:MAG: hypothetical protein RMK90_12650 [Acetobacteraceae bacterium]|nr:hypothetical protein [Acetobacteraceae bacterium]
MAQQPERLERPLRPCEARTALAYALVQRDGHADVPAPFGRKRAGIEAGAADEFAVDVGEAVEAAKPGPA